MNTNTNDIDATIPDDTTITADASIYHETTIAPGEKKGKIIIGSAKQERVRKTVRIIVGKLTGVEPGIIKDYVHLGQHIIPEDINTKIIQRMENIHQDQAIGEYLSGEIPGANPLRDIAPGIMVFKKYIEKLNIPHIKKIIENRGKDSSFASMLSSRFIMVRHGEKDKDGNLSDIGSKEAVQAGDYAEDINNSGSVRITGVFGVQQPNVQMLMSAFQLGTNWDNNYVDSEAVKNNWKSLPAEWKTPYRTAEVTLFDVMLSEDFSSEDYNNIKGDELKSEDELKSDYIKNMLQIRIQRGHHSEIYDLVALDFFEEAMKILPQNEEIIQA